MTKTIKRKQEKIRQKSQKNDKKLKKKIERNRLESTTKNYVNKSKQQKELPKKKNIKQR